MSLPLDRNKPLWELWVVEGVSDNRFAILSKTHHCMMDGVASAEVMVAAMGRIRATRCEAEALAAATGADPARADCRRAAPQPRRGLVTLRTAATR